MSRKNLKIILAVLLAAILGLTIKPDFALAGWTQGKFNYGIDFNGSSTYIDGFGDIGNIKTISFWMKADDITDRKIMQFNTTTPSYLEIDASSAIQAQGFNNPTIYVDGKVSSTLPDTNWHHIAITTDTNVSASAVVIGKVTIDTTDYYFDGILDDVRLYNYVRTLDEIRLDYNAGLAVKLGGSPSGTFTGSNLLPAWKYRRPIEISGNTSDLSDYQVKIELPASLTSSLVSNNKL